MSSSRHSQPKRSEGETAFGREHGHGCGRGFRSSYSYPGVVSNDARNFFISIMQKPATAIMLSTVIRAHCKNTDVKYFQISNKSVTVCLPQQTYN